MRQVRLTRKHEKIMHIDKIELFHVAMPMKAVWRTAFSEEHAIESIIVRLVADGVEGWGETAPYRTPQFSPEWADGAFGVMRDCLGPQLLGEYIDSGEALQKRLAPFKGNYFAKAGLDNAWWDAAARKEGAPLWQMIGGQGPVVTVGADISVQDSIPKLLHDVSDAQDAGFQRIKLKFRAESGVDMVKQVRKTFPDAVIHIDCNSGFSRQDLPLFRALDQCGLSMIEQPLAYDDLLDHAWLQSQLSTPICLDESIISVDRARKAIDIDACRWVNIKPGRVGGLTNAIAIHDLCAERGVPCWVGGMLESAIGQGPALALATLTNIAYPSDVFPSDRLYKHDLAEPEIVLSAPSEIRAPDAPGHGHRPHPERLAACTIKSAQVVHV